MTAREQAIEAAARAAFETEYPRYSETAVEDSNRWSWLGDGHGDDVKDEYRRYAEAALAAAVPVLLNDLADRIEEERMGDEIDDWNVALIKAAETVRAAAEGWGA